MPRSWVARAGDNGANDEWALDRGFLCAGFYQVDDLTSATSRDDVLELVMSAYPDRNRRVHGNFASQMWAFRGRMAVGDYVVLPLRISTDLAIGRITGDYRFDRRAKALGRRHRRAVKWLRDDVPRSAVRRDLLNTLDVFLAIYEVPDLDDKAWRVTRLAASGTDPGPRGGVTPTPPAASDRDRVAAYIGQHYTGHRLTDLVAALLTADGYVCRVSPPGPDGGVDIRAGRGPLGIDPPYLVVQVKSGAKVTADIVRDLQGVVATHRADQALLVSWNGLTPPARQTLARDLLRFRVWDRDDIVDAVYRCSDRLPADIRADIPL